jgi:hypothetical protein
MFSPLNIALRDKRKNVLIAYNKYISPRAGFQLTILEVRGTD